MIEQERLRKKGAALFLYRAEVKHERRLDYSNKELNKTI